jgi:hypothetical protein
VPASCASTAPQSPPRPSWTASSCCAPPTPPCRPPTSRSATNSCWRSSAAGGT